MTAPILPINQDPDDPRMSAIPIVQKKRTQRSSVALINGRSQRVSVVDLRDDFQERAKHVEKHDWVLDPTGRFMRKWDFIVSYLLLFTALVTPFEVAFLKSKLNFLFVVNRMVDIGFIADMIIQCFVSYVDLETNQKIHNMSKIRARYFRGWFTLDLISVLPFDSVAMAVNDSSFARLKVVRVVRLLRLVKLIRILRSSRIIQRLEIIAGISHAFFKLSKFVLVMLFQVHLFACVWRMAPLFSSLADEPSNWITESKLFGKDALYNEEREEWEYSTPIVRLYLACFEFALKATVISYGDFRPVNPIERAVALIIFMIAGSTYAYVIGAICGLLSSVDMASQTFFSDLDLINIYIQERKVAPQLSRDIRKYFTHCRQLYRSEFYQNAFAKLSPAIQGRIAVFEHGEWIRTISFFNPDDEDERHRFVIQMAREVDMVVFGPAEAVFNAGDRADGMYIVHKGLIGFEHRVLTAGQCFGVDMIRVGNRRPSPARALTFCNLYRLLRKRLMGALDTGSFPQTLTLVRRKAIWMNVKLKMRHIAKLLTVAPGYVPWSYEEKQKRLRFYRSLAKQRNKERIVKSRRESNQAAKDERAEKSAAEKSAAEHAAQTLASHELDYFTNGHREGFVMPKGLMTALAKRRDSDRIRDSDRDPISVGWGRVEERIEDALQNLQVVLGRTIEESVVTMQTDMHTKFDALQRDTDVRMEHLRSDVGAPPS
jgi:potassium voltage-gated channel Eag-related subfamily H protein 7